MSFELYARPGTPHIRDGLFFVVRKNGDLSIMREVASKITGERPPPDEFLVDLYYDKETVALAVKAGPAGRFSARKNGRTWIVAAPDFFEAFRVQIYAATRYPAEQFGDMWIARLTNGVRTGRPKRIGAAVSGTALDEPVLDLDFKTVRETNVLHNNAIYTVGELIQHSEKDLLGMKWIGPIVLSHIREALAKKGLALR